jgi:hypothetical protein
LTGGGWRVERDIPGTFVKEKGGFLPESLWENPLDPPPLPLKFFGGWRVWRAIPYTFYNEKMGFS